MVLGPHSINRYEKAIENMGKKQLTIEDLTKKVFDTNDSTEIEANVKELIKQISMQKEFSEDTKLERITNIKTKLQGEITNTFVVPEKSESEYLALIDILKSYLEAILLENDNIETMQDDIDVDDEQIRQEQVSPFHIMKNNL